jgi:ABC-2 type transport system ATP-binding protein
MTQLGLDVQTGTDSLVADLGDVAAEAVAAAVVAAGARLRGLQVERPHLEELFVSLTGEGFDVLR